MHLLRSRFFSGAFVGLLAAPMIALGDTDDIGRRTGMYMTVLAAGAVAGPPISGAINVATGGYEIVGIYAGMCYTAIPFTRLQARLKSI